MSNLLQDPLLQPLVGSAGQATGKSADLAKTLLQSTDLPQDRIDEQYAAKIDHKSLLLHPAKKIPGYDARKVRALKARRLKEAKRKPRPMTSRERKDAAFGQIPKEAQKYELYLGLHDLWCDYIRDVLNMPRSTTAANGEQSQRSIPHLRDASVCERLLKADYHGALVRVTKSKCPSYVRLEGIVVKETRNTFIVCTRKDQCKTIPKECSVFEFQLPPVRSSATDGATNGTADTPTVSPLKWEVFGEHFGFRAADRAGRKFKGKGTIEFD